MSLKMRWLRFKYNSFRRFVIVPWWFIFRYKLRIEGYVPATRPVMLAPVHRTAIDTFAISYSTPKIVSFVSTDTFGHSWLINALQRRATTSLGSVVWKESGISNSRQRAVVLTKAVGQKLSEDLIVAAFTQGRYQSHAVESIEEGIIGMVRRYASRHNKLTGQELRVQVIPVGIEYDFRGRGLVFSKTAERLARFIPLFPKWPVPAFGSKITVRFGEPHYSDDGSPVDVTRSVMQEAAALSNIPFSVP